jgi:ornithine carbamoyltransferase
MKKKPTRGQEGSPLRGRDFLSIADISGDELKLVLDTAERQKRGKVPHSLAGKTIVLIFEKPSLRTKMSFDIAVAELGGHCISLQQSEIGLGIRESVSDVAQVLARFADAVVIRTYSQKTLEEFAAHSSVPVVNSLTDAEHPCQALADLLTIREHKGKLGGVRIAYVGDGNNVAASLAIGAALSGAHFSIATPKGYEMATEVMRQVQRAAKKGGSKFLHVRAPEDAVRGADVVYTDVWTSMGQERETKNRLKAFRNYQVTRDRMRLAKPNAIFMHDLPAHRGEEVAAEVIDGRHSVVFDQAENRLHAQRALLHLLLGR